MKKTLWLVIAASILLYIPLAGAQAVPSLNREQAKSLVLTYLKSQGHKTESAEFSLDDNPDEKDLPDYFLFDAYYNTATRLTSIGAFAVDRRSAALWQRVSCEQVSSDSLQKLQDKLRKQIGQDLATPSESEATSSPCY